MVLFCDITKTKTRKKERKKTLQIASWTTCKKAQLAILITTVVWDNVLKR